MSSSKAVRLLWLGALWAGGCSTAGVATSHATEVCAPRASEPLRYVDVFDGAAADLAKLVPDVAEERSGHWQLSYVYEAGRFVTVRCKYADGHTQDVKLAAKVSRCSYRLAWDRTLKVSCEQ